MKKIMLCIHNCLMAASITHTLNQTGSFLVYSICPGCKDAAKSCEQASADILVMEAAYELGTTLEDCLNEAQLLRSLRPQCKVILLCDENSAPEIARQVAQAKKDERIDDFIYSSVSQSYLTALLSSI
ncbi:MAG: hypothetical protein J6K89_09825 [Oscillospiraceae bacterium]|nr:hypothetical protein [Bacteroidales bacterium]MBP3413544.1 hypothetical protein [Oscillospiraceae bacterium]